MNSINLSKLGVFGTIATQQGDHGRTTLRFDGVSKYKAGDVYDATKLGDRWFRSQTDKTANNEVRTKLLEHLAAAFGLKGVQRDATTGAVTFSKDLLDTLEKSLGKDVLKRGDFGIGSNGKVDSGSPLTERRITAIVNRVRDLSGTAAGKRLAKIQSVLEMQMSQSMIAFAREGDRLSLADTAKIVKLFQMSGCKMEAVNTVGKLKGFIEKATGRACYIASPNPNQNPDYLEAQISNPVSFKKLFADTIAQSVEIQKAAESFLEVQVEGRMGLRNAVNTHPLPAWHEQMEAFDYDTADVVIGKDNLSEIRKDPCGRGAVVTHYPNELKELDELLKKSYAKAGQGERMSDRFELYYSRQFLFEIDGREMSSHNTTTEDFRREIETFFGDDVRLQNTINSLFGGHLSLAPLHDQEPDVFGMVVTANKGPRSLQKFSLSRNDDGSIRISCKFCVMEPSEVSVCRNVRIPEKDGNPTEAYVPVILAPAENGPAPQGSYVSYQLCFDVVQGENGPETKGVGEYPASMKFNLNAGYTIMAKSIPLGAELI